MEKPQEAPDECTDADPGTGERIVAEFEEWVKRLSEQTRAVEHEDDQQHLEEQVRSEGLAMLGTRV